MFGYENGVAYRYGRKELWINDKITNYNDIPKNDDTYLDRIYKSTN